LANPRLQRHPLTPGLTDLEIASGLIFGDEPGGTAQLAPVEVVEALEAAIRPALQRPPCVVSFSGGVDSSLVLSVATRLARREGLPLPVPVSMRYPAHPATAEDEWQELVIGWLGLEDWERVETGSEMELLGPLAQETLRRAGVLWPPNAFMLAQLCQAAPGGSVLTGIDGDTLFSGSPWGRLPLIGRRQVRPNRGDLRVLGLRLLPKDARARAIRAGRDPEVEWLRPDAAAELAEAWSRQEASEPVGWQAWIGWLQQSRYLAVLRRSYAALGDAWDSRIVHPLFDPTFMEAVGRAGGHPGFPDRSAAIRALFPAQLPAELAHRRTKVHFSTVLWGPATADFARDWDGHGLPDHLVDPERLRASWLSDDPDLRSGLCVHAAWLAREERRVRSVA
jgi:asparagine synthase (glutamine-hydrolysing)